MNDLGAEAEKGKRSDFLNKLYDLAKGSPREVDISELHKELGLDIGQTQKNCQSDAGQYDPKFCSSPDFVIHNFS